MMNADPTDRLKVGRRCFRNQARTVDYHTPTLPFWSLALILCMCTLFLASDCNKIAKTSLCVFCGSDTFACGSNMEQALQQADNQSWPMFLPLSQNESTTSLSPPHLLNAKVQRMLLQLQLNRNLQVFNSSNCTCIPASWRCDRSFDCEDFSDEIGCADAPVGFESECDPEHFQCNDDDGGAENQDHNSTCKLDEYQCQFQHQCIPKEFHCDRQNFDCIDRSDEIGCTAPTIVESPLELMVASEGETVTLHCRSTGVPVPVISWHKKASGAIASPPRVTSSSVEGAGTLTIRNVTSDDQGTYSCEAFNSLDSVITPGTLLVIKHSHGQVPDNDTDRQPLQPTASIIANECTSGTFQCRDGSCVSLSVLCDGRPNCPEGSDEDTNSTCKPGTSPCYDNGLICQHICLSTGCACKQGYRKGGDGYSCVDINECSIGSLRELDFSANLNPMNPLNVLPNIQVCSQLCINFVPGFMCSCAPGYRLEANRRQCSAIQGSDALLLVGWSADLLSVSLLDHFKKDTTSFGSAAANQNDAEDAAELSSNVPLKPVVSLDFLYSKKLVFWSDPKTRKIFRALMELNQKSLTQSSTDHASPLSALLRLHQVRPLIESGLVMPSGLAVDWINERLYWTDCETRRIEFSSLEGTLRTVLLMAQKPHSIAIHPEISTIFFTDWGELPRIERVFMDGSGREVIVSALLSLPTGLVIDYPASKLYWTDSLQNMIMCANFDGSGRFIIGTGKRPTSLSIFEDNLYFANSMGIHTVSKLTGEAQATIKFDHLDRSKLDREFDVELKVLHALRQPEVESKSPCHSSPCSHLCLPNNVSYRCSCPFGHRLDSKTDHTCHLVDSLLLFTQRSDIRAVALAKTYRYLADGDLPNDFNVHVLPMGHIGFAVSLDYDTISSTLYWSDLVNKSIGRAKWSHADSVNQQEIILKDLESPASIAFDWATGNLYWADGGRNVIEVARGSFRSLLVWSLDEPRDIVLDPLTQLMFWSQWNNQSASIQRCAMDGSSRIILHSHNLTRPHGLAVDPMPGQMRICWTDSARALIECSFYDGSDRRTVISKNVQYPFAVTIADELIYWSDLHQRNVQQAHKITGEMQTILFENTDSLMDILVLHPNRSTLQRHEFAIANACKQGKCSHLCLLSPQSPGYKCACPTGIRLLEDDHTCADDMTKYLIFTTRKAIRRISLHSEHHLDVNLPIQMQMENAFVLDVHSKLKLVFWSDTSENIIYRANMLSGQVEPVVRFGLFGSNGLAVDDVGDKLYWTDAGRKRIEVANLDGSFRRVLISNDLDSPRAIAVNYKSGHMVWADWGTQARIERADMDGGGRAILVSKDLGWPNGITITENGRIIWADSKTCSIEMVDLNGSRRQKLAEDLPSSPYGVALIDDHLYWTDWKMKSINRIYISSTSSSSSSSKVSKVEVFWRSLTNLPIDIRAVDDQKGLATFNLCQINNGGCSHLCLRNNAHGYSCFCPEGLILLADGKTCKSDLSNQLLLACKTSLRRISLDAPEYHDVHLPVNNLLDVLSVDYHYSTGQIFYIDGALKEIRSITLADTSAVEATEAFSKQVVVFGELSQPSSLVVDWVAHNLYWSDHERHLIEVARLDGSSRKVLIDLDLNKPKCLQLLPELGFLFWVDQIERTSVQRIERAFLDGSGRVNLLTLETGQINGLAIDREASGPPEMTRLFWTDGLLQRIESIQIDGKHRQVVLDKGLTMPFSIVVFGDFLFWSDSYNKVIERANRRTTEDYRLVADNIEALREIRVMSQLQQNRGTASSANTFNSSAVNPCALDNGACSHLCLFRPHGYICACPSSPDPRPCSTVPGEIIDFQPALTVISQKKDQNDSLFLVNSSHRPADAITPNLNHAQPDINGDLLEQNAGGNESLRLKELADLCFNRTTRCNSSRFAFDDHIIQVAYLLGLILLSAVILVCAILTFFCKRNRNGAELKLSKVEGNHLGRLENSCSVPPPPPPPLHYPAPRFREPSNFADYELSNPPHLWFSPPRPLTSAPPYMTPARLQWANSLPRHSTTGGSHRTILSAVNSPYLEKSRRPRGNQEHAHMTYLCLESSKLETDI